MLVAITWLWARPPDLIRVGANYTAKMVCSNVFLARRDPAEVLAVDVQAPGNPLLRLMRVAVDRERGVVRAGLWGVFGGGLAEFHPGTGCTVIPNPERLLPVPLQARPAAPQMSANPGDEWPQGDAVHATAGVQRVLSDAVLAGVGARALVVVHRGRIVAERYARGFDARTPQLGWSMAKSVTAGLVGVLVREGRLAVNDPAGWRAPDPRARITLADLLSMSGGLEWNESYGTVSDVTRMLFLEPDMADFARAKPAVSVPGSVWNYSSGSALIVSRIVQDAAGPGSIPVARRLLFDPLGMSSATMEVDEEGTFVGSSYLYATPRDWARYGLFLAQGGVWRGAQLLPPDFVTQMAAPSSASDGEYGRGFVWRYATHGKVPHENPDAAFGLPNDTFWMSGHDGQYVAIIPSRELVVVRLGLTPSSLGYQPQPLVAAVLRALR